MKQSNKDRSKQKTKEFEQKTIEVKPEVYNKECCVMWGYLRFAVAVIILVIIFV